MIYEWIELSVKQAYPTAREPGVFNLQDGEKLEKRLSSYTNLKYLWP